MTAVIVIAVQSLAATAGADDRLMAHWPLAGDAHDASGHGIDARPYGVDFSVAGPSGRAGTAAGFDGQAAWLEVPAGNCPEFGSEDFSVAAWIYSEAVLDDVSGDILSRYDPSSRRGFHLALKTNAGVTFSQANARHLQFCIDQDRAADVWTDRGRPGDAVLAFALCVFDGNLFAGTCESGRDGSGHVYRYEGEDPWIDCGAPDGSNAVTALAVFEGQLYAGTGKYRLAGSSLPESENEALGGRLYRYEGGTRWVDCGGLPHAEAVGGLAVFRGRLYASSLYRPAGFFRYEGEQNWADCGAPERPEELPGDTTHMRVEALGIFNGSLYATSYDGGHVFRFDGKSWFDCGQLGENTQAYSFAVRAGRLYVGTWPSGRVYRLDGPKEWTDVGRLGEELEVMGMLVHNGRLIAGTLPLAEVYQFDERGGWGRLTRLDHTPDVRYRRAWTMAEYGGHVFCTTLPSGRVYSWQAGRVAMSNRELPSGWHHVAAVRGGGSLYIFIDGELAGMSAGFAPRDYDLSCNRPLRIGLGPNDFFKGRLSDVRLYRRALEPSDIRKLAEAWDLSQLNRGIGD